MSDVGLAAKAVHDSAEKTGSPDPELQAELEATGLKVQQLGWPEELKDEQIVIGDGPATDEQDDLEEYQRALRDSQQFVLDQCDLEPGVAENIFGG